MSFVIGRGRYARATYPENSGGGAVGALRNRNVAASPQVLTAPFTPGLIGSPSLIAAIIFTPRVSGVIQVGASLDIQNGATADTYGMSAIIFNGTGLTVSGGENSSNDWFSGSNTPPVVGGAGIVQGPIIGVAIEALAINGQGSLAVSGISQPLPVGVPVAIEVFLTEVGGGNPLAGPIAFFSLSVLELP